MKNNIIQIIFLLLALTFTLNVFSQSTTQAPPQTINQLPNNLSVDDHLKLIQAQNGGLTPKEHRTKECMNSFAENRASAENKVEETASNLIQSQADMQQQIFDNAQQVTRDLQAAKIEFEERKSEYDAQKRAMRKTRRDAANQRIQAHGEIRRQCTEQANAFREQERARVGPGTVTNNVANLAGASNRAERSFGQAFSDCMNDPITRQQWHQVTRDYQNAVKDFDDAEEGFEVALARAHKATVEQQSLIQRSKKETVEFIQLQFANLSRVAASAIRRVSRTSRNQLLLSGFGCLDDFVKVRGYNKKILKKTGVSSGQ